MSFSSTTNNSTGNTSWWTRSPYYQQYYNYVPFLTYTPSKERFPQPKEETLQAMTDEEFDGALNELLFGGDK